MNSRNRGRKSRKDDSSSVVSDETKSQNNRSKGAHVYAKLLRLSQTILDSNESAQARQNAAFTLETELLHLGGHPDTSKAITILMHGNEEMLPLGSLLEDSNVSVGIKKGVVRALAAILATYRGSTANYFRWLYGKTFTHHFIRPEIQIEYFRVLKEILDPKLPRSEHYFNHTHVSDESLRKIARCLESTDSPVLASLLIDIFRVINTRQPNSVKPHISNVVLLVLGWIYDIRLSKSQYQVFANFFTSVGEAWKQEIQMTTSALQYANLKILEYFGIQTQIAETGEFTYSLPAGMAVPPFSDVVYRLLDFSLIIFQCCCKGLSECESLNDPIIESHILWIMSLISEILNYQFTFPFARIVLSFLSITSCVSGDQQLAVESLINQVFSKLFLRVRELLEDKGDKYFSELFSMLDSIESLGKLRLTYSTQLHDLFFCTDEQTSLLALVLQRKHSLDSVKHVARIYDFISKVVNCVHVLPNSVEPKTQTLTSDCGLIIQRAADQSYATGIHWIDAEKSRGNLIKYLELHLSLVQIFVKRSLPCYEKRLVFETVAGRTFALDVHIRSSHWWLQIEGKIFTLLHDISQCDDYFAPALHIRPIELKDTCFETQCQVLRVLLLGRKMSRLTLGHKWLRSLLGLLRARNRFETDVVDSAALAAVEEILLHVLTQLPALIEPAVRIMIANTWEFYLSLFGSNHRGHPHTKEIVGLCLNAIDDCDDAVRDAFMSVLANMDSFDTLASLGTFNNAYWNATSMSCITQASLFPSTFSESHIMYFFSYIGAETPGASFCMSSLSAVFTRLQSTYSLRQNGLSRVRRSVLLKWFSWDAACHLINAKLKLFGDPMTMLNHLELTLNRYVSIIHDPRYSTNTNVSFDTRLLLLEKLSLCLDFIDALDILFQRAAHGSFEESEIFPISVASFFLANLQVCEGWFTRIGETLIQAAKICGKRSLFQRQIKNQLLVHTPQDSTRFWIDLLSLCQSYIQENNHDELIGLASWISKVPFDDPRKQQVISFLNAVSHQSAFRIEKALTLYDNIQPTDGPETSMIHESKVFASHYLYDWKRMEDLFKESEQANPTLVSKIALEALSHWNQEPSWQDLSYGNEKDNLSLILSDFSSSNLVENLWADSLLLSCINESKEKAVAKLDIGYGTVRSLYSLHTSVHGIRDISWIVNLQLFTYAKRSLLVVQDKTTSAVRLTQAKSTTHIPKEAVNAQSFDKWLRISTIRKSFDQRKDPDLDEIRSSLANIARKCDNLALAESLLVKYHDQLTSLASLRSAFKYAKLLSHRNQHDKSFAILAHVVNDSTHLSRRSDEEREVFASAYLKLAQTETNDIKERVKSRVPALQNYSNILLAQDVSRMVMLANAVETGKPSFHKPLFQYAEFCYKQAHNVIGAIHMFLRSSKENVHLGGLSSQLNHLSIEDQKAFLHSILNRFSEANTDSGSYLSHASEQGQKKMGTFVHDAFCSIVELLTSSIVSYFEYLRIGSDTTSKKSTRILTTTLRLLRVLTTYGTLLQDEFRTHIQITPVKCWIGVIPQLFSRLHHPDTFVQECICTLLVRIGDDLPSQILFSTILASNIQTTDETKAVLETSQSGTQDSATFILLRLREKSPNLVESTIKFAGHLQQIGILWEEKWLSFMEKFVLLFQTRLDELDKIYSIADRLNSSASEKLRLRKHYDSVAFGPYTKQLRALYNLTLGSGPTNQNQKFFVESCGPLIDTLISSIDKMNGDSTKEIILRQSKQLLSALRNKLLHSRIVNVEEFCPLPEFFSETHSIPMPGQQIFDGEATVSINSVKHEIRIISSKSMPKRISFMGTDGVSYIFLLKGHEDLRLDERIQQFLETANVILDSNVDARHRKLMTRTYSVTPFSTQFGLIGWVENAPSILNILRKWEHHQKAILSSRKGSLDENPKNMVITRGRSLFDGFLNQCLSLNKGDDKQALETRVFAFREMTKIVPSNLLSSELLSSSIDSTQYLEKQSRYIRSTATMAVLGHIIGLGDRHLNNILIDLISGEIIHIDFDVCLDKGKRMLVPETVPCRLTRNLVQAFGPLGLEGPFRLACEIVLETMKQASETLVTLLEAFKYDPLVSGTDSTSQENEPWNNLITYCKHTDVFKRLNVDVNEAIKRELDRNVSALSETSTTLPLSTINIEDLLPLLDLIGPIFSRFQSFVDKSKNSKTSFLRVLHKFCALWKEIHSLYQDALFGKSNLTIQQGPLREALAIYTKEILPVWEAGENPGVSKRSSETDIVAEEKSKRSSNDYTTRALKRIGSRLEGKEEKDGKHFQLDVNEQVDHIINEAMSEVNLCRMFEGFQAWL